MTVDFSAKFYKDLERIHFEKIKYRIANVIDECKKAEKLSEVKNVKKLIAYDTYYRIRVGEYRIGFEYGGKVVRFLRVLNRNEIYKAFP